MISIDNACLSSPCLRGSCEQINKTLNYKCVCPMGYTGERCEQSN